MSQIENMYLKDLHFKSDFATSKSGDVLRISGKENLNQALLHRLVTVKGSLVHRPEFGVGVKEFQNNIANMASQRELAIRIREQFVLEPRVNKVTSVRITKYEEDDSKFSLIVKYQDISYNNLEETFKPFEIII